MEKMKKEAEIHAVQDKKKKELAEVKNMASNLIYISEKTLKELGDNISDEVKKEVKAKMEALKKVKDSDSIEDIKSKIQELSQVLQKIGAEIYKKPPQAEEPKEK